MSIRRFIVPVAVVALAAAILIHVGGSRAHAHVPPHCGFWTSIEAGLSCR
ncbi:hypothetical protein [Bradyrhizobium elkanii]|nr:hypothetical protein [Bradyrhizobium elkanii]MCP1970050.1 hypothetical protein [Bradyrhizobium elkanii]MCS3517211.1 hypothetical protein [Bradyrhizobium elkanii]MCS4073768.1 hypothetical protein [Bradyrhizobium elkanii]MCS4080402.1 hypothetical protein [Bradyrhizobium elkanii]MCS4108443.1 hypothetical protein [Bradyrhizobium elkanii]